MKLEKPPGCGGSVHGKSIHSAGVGEFSAFRGGLCALVIFGGSRRLARSIEKFLLEEKERRLVQFTYASGEPFDLENPELEWRREGVVWLNTPPAFVWVLERRP